MIVRIVLDILMFTISKKLSDQISGLCYGVLGKMYNEEMTKSLRDLAEIAPIKKVWLIR